MKPKATTASEAQPAFVFGTPVMTLDEVAESLGVTKNAIFCTEKRALTKLRRILIRRLGPEFFDDYTS